jgi:uncharacterized protein (DUF2141 family)
MKMIKSTAFLLALSAGVIGAPVATAGEGATLKLELTGLETRGTVRVLLFDEADAFDKGGKPVAGDTVAVDEPTEIIPFEGLAPGSYAVKLVHDVNDNGKMDTNPFGMPTEPYAFSNNARGNFGPAKWDKASFDLTEEGLTQTLTVK